MSKNKAPVLDAVFDALSNEHRRDIVSRLAHGTMTTPAIGRQYGFTKQALSRHIGLMEKAGLVSRVRHGRVDHLKLVPERLDSLTHWVSELKAGWISSLNSLDRVLGELQD